MDNINTLRRELAQIKSLLMDSADNWKTKDDIMERLGVKSSTVDTWAKMYPQIFKYRKSEKGTDINDRTIRRGHLYNIKLILDLVYTTPLKKAG